MKITNNLKWAIGLIEAEGYIGFNNNSLLKWVIVLKVSMKNNNSQAIYKLKKLLKAGSISHSEDGMLTYQLRNTTKFLTHIKPILDAYPFKSSKYYEYLLTLEAIKFLQSDYSVLQKDNLLTELKIKLQEIKLDRYKIAPNIVLDDHWLAGFIEGDGSLQINNKNQLVFELGQAYNHLLLEKIKDYLNIKTKIYIRKDDSYAILRTKKKETIDNLINKLKNKLLGSKSLELKIWAYANNTKLEKKVSRAKLLLKKLR